MPTLQPEPADRPVDAPDDLVEVPDELVEVPDDEDSDLEGDLDFDEPEAIGSGLLARAGAELFGTFVLVFAGVGTMLYGQYNNIGGSLAVAAAFGIAAAVSLATVGRTSGGHFNPAISLGAAISGRLSWADLLPYWLAQLVGGALGSAVLFLTIPNGLGQLLGGSADKRDLLGYAANGFGPNSPLAHLLAKQSVTSAVTFSLTAALLVEVVATGILVAVYLAATRHTASEPRAPFIVGLALTVLVLVALPVTNASLNPARSTAVAILAPSWALAQLWLFWLAPLLGAVLAALLYRAFVPPTPAADEAEDDDDYVDDEPDQTNPFTLTHP
jgi:aquaporin Z